MKREIEIVELEYKIYKINKRLKGIQTEDKNKYVRCYEYSDLLKKKKKIEIKLKKYWRD